jgi:hypothetical protein
MCEVIFARRHTSVGKMLSQELQKIVESTEKYEVASAVFLIRKTIRPLMN